MQPSNGESVFIDNSGVREVTGNTVSTAGYPGVDLDAIQRLLTEHQRKLLDILDQMMSRQETLCSSLHGSSIMKVPGSSEVPAILKQPQDGGKVMGSLAHLYENESKLPNGLVPKPRLLEALESQNGACELQADKVGKISPIENVALPLPLPPEVKADSKQDPALPATCASNGAEHDSKMSIFLPSKPSSKKSVSAEERGHSKAQRNTGKVSQRMSSVDAQTVGESQKGRESRSAESRSYQNDAIMNKVESARRSTAYQKRGASFVGSEPKSSQKQRFISFFVEEPAEPVAMTPKALADFKSGRGREAPATNCVQLLVRSNLFELSMSIVILTNSIFVGFQVEYSATQKTEKSPIAFYIIQYCYSAIFLTELVLRVMASGRSFFKPFRGQWQWNYLDIFIVATSLFEVVMDTLYLVSGENSGSNAGISGASNARIIRILRIARLIRIIRIARILRFIHALRTFIYSIIATLKSLIWALVLLFMILYVFGILFAQTAGDHLMDVADDNLPEEVKFENILIDRYWGSLPRSMFTLFKAISGGVSWDEVVHPIATFGSIWVAVFTSYIAFVYFAVLNVVTGIFCQSAIETAQENEDLMVQAQIASKELYVARIKRLFNELDEDESGGITFGELEAHIHDENVQAVFGSMEIDTTDAWTLFKLLDSDEGTEVDIEEFVAGLMRLKGNAKRADFVELHVALGRMSSTVSESSCWIETLVEKVEALMSLSMLSSARDNTTLPRDEEGAQPIKPSGHKDDFEDDQRITDFFQAPWDYNMQSSLIDVSQHKPWDLLLNDDEVEPQAFELEY